MTTTSPPPPPRRACRLLASVLPPTVSGRSMLGDVIEEYHRRQPGLWRRLWFWLITGDLVVRYLPGRLAGGLAGVGSDAVYAVRLARRYPTLIVAAVLSLGLAIGVGTAAFSVVNGTLLRRTLAYEPAFVTALRSHQNGRSKSWPVSELHELRRHSRLVALEAWQSKRLSFRASLDGAPSEPVPVQFVTGSYLATLGARVTAGRALGAADDAPGAGAVVVLSHLFWRRQFGGDRAVLGRTIWIAGSPFSVVGITDRGFVDPTDAEPAAWTPLPALDQMSTSTPGPRTVERINSVGRLQRGVTIEQAEVDLTRLVSKLAWPRMTGVPAAVGVNLGAAGLSAADASRATRVVIVVLAVIALVILLACANVSNLQLAGAAARRQEIAIRLSCGASAGRVARQLVTESVGLSAAAGAVGFLLATWLSPALALFVGMESQDIDPDTRVYAFVLCVSAVAAIGSGLAPARQSVRIDVSTSLKGLTAASGAVVRPRRASSTLIAAQAAASIVLLALTALLVRALIHVAWQDPGVDVNRLLAVSAAFPRTTDAETQATAYWSGALARVRAMPAIEDAALVWPGPLGIQVGDPETVLENGTDAAYFAVTGLRLIRGRIYNEAEVNAREPLMVISERVAHRFWGQDDPIGASAERVSRRRAHFRVIGLVGDAVMVGPREGPTPVVYVPLSGFSLVNMVVRTEDPRSQAAPLGDALGALSRDVRPVVSILADRYASGLERPRRYATLAAGVAMLALTLAAVGLFGVTAFSVRSRTREIGIRLALGARASDVRRLLLRDGMKAVVVGLIAGLGVALLAGQAIAGLLYGVSARDPLALTAATAVLLITATTAVLVPARRAANHPAAALRES
jgi:putative ABC transport system permease protein